MDIVFLKLQLGCWVEIYLLVTRFFFAQFSHEQILWDACNEEISTKVLPDPAKNEAKSNPKSSNFS